MAFQTAFLCFLLLALHTNDALGANHEMSFDSGNFNVSWTHQSDEIEFNVTVKATGWVALGISTKNTQMQNIDLFVGKYASSIATVEDYYSTTTTMPSKDAEQNFNLVTGSEANGVTNIVCKRKLDTNDTLKDIKIEAGSKYYIVWAYHSSMDVFYAKHTNRSYSPSMVELVPLPPSTTPPPSTTSSPSTTAPPITLDPNSVTFNGGKVSWVSHDSESIIFTMQAKAAGWVGLGISTENSGMKGLDITIGGVAADRAGYIGDYSASTTTTPTKDGKQNVQLLRSEVQNGETTIEFKRKLNTGDENDIVIKAGEQYYLAWAYHKTSDDIDNLMKHTAMGYTNKVVLVAGTSHASCTVVLLVFAVAAALFFQSHG